MARIFKDKTLNKKAKTKKKKTKKILNKKKKTNKSEVDRFKLLVPIIALIFISIISRLVYLQIVKGDEYKDKANDKSITQLSVAAPRGEILDKNNQVLATNVQSYALVYTETDEIAGNLFDTLKEIFKIVDSSTYVDNNGKVQNLQIEDELALKTEPYRFEFNTDSDDVKKAKELRFKKDRGFQDSIIAAKFGNNKKEADLTEDEQKVVNDELMKITAEQVFKQMFVQYKIYKLGDFTEDEIKKLNSIVTIKTEEQDKLVSSAIEKVSQKYSLKDVRRYLLVADAVKMQSFSGYKPITIASNISKETSLIFEQLKVNLPGIDIVTKPIRYYPNGELGANFIGYISKIDEANKDYYSLKGYDISSDYVGMSGIESSFEERLRGISGGSTVKINKFGRTTEELFNLKPYQGQNVVLTIDKDLQSITEQALSDTLNMLQTTAPDSRYNTKNATRGAAVVVDVNTGAVLAMASNPSYDPNTFAVSGRLTQELSEKYFSPNYDQFADSFIKKMGATVSKDVLFPKNENGQREDAYDVTAKPLFNYATMSLTPPGSTFKPLTSIAGLEEGLITANTTINCIAAPYSKNNYGGACWIYNDKRGGHGPLNVASALRNSCNYFMFEVGDRLYSKGGLDLLASWAWKFGLGAKPGDNAVYSTGLEIDERFGQVYNDTSRRTQAQTYGIMNIVPILRQGQYNLNGVNFKFAALETGKNGADSKELADAKEAFKDVIRNEIKVSGSAKESYPRLVAQIPATLKNIISSLPKEQQGMYTEDDITNMSEVVASYIAYTTINEALTPGNVYDASIGQGMDNFTPVQLASYIATLVNGGKRYSVHLVDKFTDSEGSVIEQIKPKVLSDAKLSKYNVETVKNGMNEVAGSLPQMSGFPMKIGIKTGTATYANDQTKYGRTNNAVEVGFAPYDNPQIAVAIMVFDGGTGSLVTPLMRGIFEGYFRDELKKSHPTYKPMFDYALDPSKLNTKSQ